MRLKLLQIGGGVDLRPVRSLAMRVHQLEFRLARMDELMMRIQRTVDVMHATAESFAVETNHDPQR